MPITPNSPDVSIVSEMITPALFIVASGSLLGTVLARLGRVVDAFRTLRAEPPDPSHSASLEIYERRAELAERAMMSFYSAVTCFVATCLFIALNRVTERALVWVPVGAAILGVSLLTFGSGCMIAECRVALRQLRGEISAAKRRVGS